MEQAPFPVEFSTRASDELAGILAEMSAPALRIAVVGGGCAGYSYAFTPDGEPAVDDLVLRLERFKVFVDPMSAELLRGATVDWRDELMNAGPVISNPNATVTCGCGSSFG